MADPDSLGAAVDTAVTQLDITAWLDVPPWRFWGGRTTDELVAQYGEPGPSMPVQLCNGMGVDTAAIITRLIEDPDSRVLLVTEADGRRRLVRVDLHDITVVTAMTGNEFRTTEQVMNDHLLPRMRSAGLRYVQVARGGQSQEDGIVVLDDSTSPQRMFMRGPWSLSDELIAAGTVPQTAARSRRCSYRAKGWVLDQWAASEYAGADRVHILGFAAEETARVEKDQSYSHATRRSVYPLRQWGWDRQQCEDYLLDQFGIIWPRSCCMYCPFAGGSKRKNALLAARWAAEPAAGVLALTLETVALGLNPRMKLFKDVSAWQVAVEQQLHQVLALTEAHLDQCKWAVYDVQRVFQPAGAKKNEPITRAMAKRMGIDEWKPGMVIKHPGDPGKKGRAARRTRQVRTGTRHEMAAMLEAAADGRHEPGRTPRLWLIDRQNTYPTIERMLVAAPAGVADKEEDGFAALWANATRRQGAAGRLTKHPIAV